MRSLKKEEPDHNIVKSFSDLGKYHLEVDKAKEEKTYVRSDDRLLRVWLKK